MPQSSLPQMPRSVMQASHLPGNGAGAAKTWLAARKAELLPVRYFHLVFTLPKQIADIAYQNKREIYNLLMRASADTVIKIAADPKHLGARVGTTSVLHTWGSAITHHPYVHMIVPPLGILRRKTLPGSGRGLVYGRRKVGQAVGQTIGGLGQHPSVLHKELARHIT